MSIVCFHFYRTAAAEWSEQVGFRSLKKVHNDSEAISTQKLHRKLSNLSIFCSTEINISMV